MKEALNESFKWKRTNVPELDNPLLIVLDYSPADNDPHLLSIAFDFSGGPKCWLTESTVRKIGNKGPDPHSNYRKFVFEKREFHPYSIKSFPPTIFQEIQEFKRVCQGLYEHVIWNE